VVGWGWGKGCGFLWGWGRGCGFLGAGVGDVVVSWMAVKAEAFLCTITLAQASFVILST
jgi:hypothetical protein